MNELLLACGIVLGALGGFIVHHLRRPAPPEVDLTNEAFGRWLRARRPPMPLFLSMTEGQQEALAKLGDDYEQDRIIAIGYAVQNPAAAEAGTRAVIGDSAAEEDLLQQVAAGTVRRILGQAKAAAKPVAPPPPQKPADPSFLGRKPK